MYFFKITQEARQDPDPIMQPHELEDTSQLGLNQATQTQEHLDVKRQVGLFLLKSKEIHKLPRTVMDLIFRDVNSL